MARTRAEVGAGVADADLTGQTALVTGATSGIGRETALALDRLGARVFVHGRNREAGEAVADELDSGVFLAADFADLDDVRSLADDVKERTETLDVLVNNAGAHFSTGQLANSGVELTFAVNHLAPFLLTEELRPALADDGRVVTVSSAVHKNASLDLDAVERIENYDGFDAYARSKLANVLFTRELARRLDGPTTNCLHPGIVPGSGLWRHASGAISLATGALGLLPTAVLERVLDTSVTAAETSVYLAASPDVEGVSGHYFSDCEAVQPAERARDDELAARLWDRSVEWVN